MPAIVEMRLRPSRPLEPTTRQLHGLACAVFEGTYSASHVGQDKQFTIWPLNPDPDWGAPRLPDSPSIRMDVWKARGRSHPNPLRRILRHRRPNHPRLRRHQYPHHPRSASKGRSLTSPVDRKSTRLNSTHSLPAALPIYPASPNSPAPAPKPPTASASPVSSPPAISLQRTFINVSGRSEEHTSELHSLPTRRSSDLPRFAEFSGTGAQTTHGFGVTSILTTRDQPPKDVH